MRKYVTDAEKAWGLRNDPEYFAHECLKVIAWGVKGVRGIIDFEYTYLQRRVMQFIMQMMDECGEVDGIIVKPRKMKCTTVLNGWEYQQTTFHEGLTVLNIAHSAPVAEEIFDRHIKTFHEYMPAWLKRQEISDNKRELSFTNKSKIRVAVAGSGATRGPAASILHLTETGWMKADQVRDIQQAVFPSVERGPGTARIDESTSGGAGTWQHRRALQAKEGEGKNRLLFIGCYEVPEYRMTPPKDWEPNSDERAIQQEFSLDLEQIYWRHVLLKDQYDGQEMLFNMEYPATFDLAFQVSGDKFFHPIKLLKAKVAELQPDKHMPIVMGIDPAGSGDRSLFVVRQGRVVLHHEIHRNMTAPLGIQIVKRLKQQFGTDNEFIDMGYGHGWYDLGRSMGMFSLVGIYPGQAATRKDVYANLRTECAYALKAWIEEGEGGMVSIPNDREFYDDLAAVPGERTQPGTGKLILAPKDEIKKELGKSPDIFDALSYTFAYPVQSKAAIELVLPERRETSMFDTDRVFSRFDTESTIFNNMDELGIRVNNWSNVNDGED